jgi:hypothetical protein
MLKILKGIKKGIWDETIFPALVESSNDWKKEIDGFVMKIVPVLTKMGAEEAGAKRVANVLSLEVALVSAGLFGCTGLFMGAFGLAIGAAAFSSTMALTSGTYLAVGIALGIAGGMTTVVSGGMVVRAVKDFVDVIKSEISDKPSVAANIVASVSDLKKTFGLDKKLTADFSTALEDKKPDAGIATVKSAPENKPK